MKWKLDKWGDIVRPERRKEIRKKYAPDNPLEKSFVPYLLMLLCAAVDAVMFINLFKMISYDSVLMIVMEVTGLLFAFDIVVVYAGNLYKRIRQGLSKKRWVLLPAILVFVLGCAVNIALRISTIDLVAPDTSSAVSFFGEVPAETSSKLTPEAIALTIFGCAQPIITSIGSFFISYTCYDALAAISRREEKQIAQKQEEAQQYQAALREYDAMSEFRAHLQADDLDRYNALLHRTHARILGYSDYVHLRLMEHLANPTSTDRLSGETGSKLMSRLEEELKAMGIRRENPPQSASKMFIGVQMPVSDPVKQ